MGNLKYYWRTTRVPKEGKQQKTILVHQQEERNSFGSIGTHFRLLRASLFPFFKVRKNARPLDGCRFEYMTPIIRWVVKKARPPPFPTSFLLCK